MCEIPLKSRLPGAAAAAITNMMMTTMNRCRILRTGEVLSALLLFAMIASLSIEAWAQVGYVQALSGSATSRRGSAPPVPTKVGDTFEVSATFNTAGDSRVVLKFADGRIVVLGARSTARVDPCRFDERVVKAGCLAIGLQTGSMRFVDGLIASQNRQTVRISAGDSSVGIMRAGGVDFTIIARAPGPERGLAAVSSGEISIRTPYGLIASMEPGEAASWGPGRPLARPVPLAAAPAAFQAELAALLAIPDHGLESLLAALPPTAAGPEPAPANLWVLPFAPITATTGGGGRGCVGSPC